MLPLLCLLPLLVAPAVNGAKNYSDALGKSILFYDAQRSGKLPADNPIPWRGDSALDDCVVGGWYDAGDHVKFGLPLSAAVTLLSWSLVQFKDGYVKAGQLDSAYDSIKWALDYMLAAWDPEKKEFVAQIGDGDLDHSFWGRPEDMTMNRPCLKITADVPGSDILAGSAAGLAAGSLVFREKGDTDYADKLLTAAKELFTFAQANRGFFTGSDPFYTPYLEADEMCVGAMWLYKATKQADYLTFAKALQITWPGWGEGWDEKVASCQALIYEQTKDATYRAALLGYFTVNWFEGGDVVYTPCGLAWRAKWGSARHAANSALIALVAADLGIEPETLRKWAVEQINYILGDNPHDGGCYSYEIAYGEKYPLQPHHRAASCPNPPAKCDYTAPGPSPHVLIGGLVGGPDENDTYVDLRSDYVQNEVALDYNSGFQASLAAIITLEGTADFPTTNNKCPCPDK